MNFLIADTFTDSLSRLTGDEQKSVKTTAFDLQLNPASPGMSFHKLDKAKDKNFWSVRVGSNIRLIVHKTADSLLLCYVDHHDKAYAWAERRKLQTHPKTGAAQLVEIRETVQEVVVPVYVEATTPEVPTKQQQLFGTISDDDLLGFGVPLDWLDDVRAATEESLFGLADHLPKEAAESLLELATGGKPQVAKPASAETDPFQHPDAMRRFRVVGNVEELQRALDAPWEKWTVFLHPEQREWIERDYSGPARVSGSAGTGKTIVALHRAAHLARKSPESRILLTTFSDPLANALRSKLLQLVGNEPRIIAQIEVQSLVSVGLRLHTSQLGKPELAAREVLMSLLKDASNEVGSLKFSLHFLWTEWDQIVDAWQLETWEAYRDVARLGRKTRLSESQRTVLWSIFERVQNELRQRKLSTLAGMFTRLAAHIKATGQSPFDFVVIDESQDVSVSQLRFLAELGADRPNSLFFAGDLGQRIFQQPFSWKSLGVDVRGRSRTLRVNYRTSHQIRQQADRLLDPSVADVDGNREDRSDTVSIFNGPPPAIKSLSDEAEEIAFVGAWIKSQTLEGVAPHEFAVFVRSETQLPRATAAVAHAGLPYRVLDERVASAPGHVSVCTMHLAKGLEFRTVVVMACDDEVIPLQERIETVGDDADLQEVYDTERHLLYVACTRARDNLLVTSVEPASEFLDDLRT